MTDGDLVMRGVRVLRLEREAIAAVEARLDGGFAHAVHLIARSRGRVIVAGVGKSGLITGELQSTLARAADATLDSGVTEEACPHDLAPTTSTTAALALGDALAVTLLEHKGFRREDFARLHPGGALGKKLLTTVADVMENEHLPVLPVTATMREALVPLAERRGLVVLSTGEGVVSGVVTAGDLARLLEHRTDSFDVPVADVMTRTPRTARADELASGVVHRMERFGIMAMPVLNGHDRLVGVVHLHDLLRAGVV